MNKYITNTVEWINLAQEIAGIGVWHQDIKNNTLWWSDQTYRIFGMEPQIEEMNFSKFIKMVHPDFKKIIKEETKKFLISNKHPYKQEYKIIRKDGQERIIIEEAILKNDSNNIPLLITGIVQDITEKRKAEEQLRKLSKAVEQSANSIVITDINGDIEYVNSKFVELTGYTAEEAYGQNPRILKSGEQPTSYYTNLWETISAGKEWSGEFHNKKKNGDLYWEQATISPIVNNEGKIANYLAIKENITAKKNAINALKDSEKNFRLLFENSPLGTYIAKPNGEIVQVNNAALNILGSPSAEATKQINVLKFPPLIKNGYSDIFQKCVSSGKTQTIELQYKTKWGKEIYLSSYIIPLKNTENNVIKVYTIMEDISSRKFAIKQLELREKQLRESNATKDKFLSIIAHDLKNPFSAILGFSEILCKNFDNYKTAKQKEFLEIISKEIKNTYKLLENLLLWSRSQRGKIEFNPEKINLNILVQEVIGLLNPSAKNKSIEIKSEISTITQIIADRNMISTVLRNLISNAIKFTPQKGQIVIKSELIRQKLNKEFTKITIKDNGVGISNDRIPLLFDINVNNNTKGTEMEPGTGLGLIICKEFIEIHKGKISVESEKGKGSKFIILLPTENKT